MYANVSIDGEDQSIDDFESSTVEFGGENDETSHRCKACGLELIEDADSFRAVDGPRWLDAAECHENVRDESTDDDSDYGPHDPEAIPLRWVNSAGVSVDEEHDSITVWISVGDPRGGFTMEIRRIDPEADSDLAGKLIMHLPHEAASMLHMPLKELHAGTYVIGD